MATNKTDGFDGPLIGGRYKLGRTLGSGGQGTTHLALDTKDGRTVAVKTLELGKVKEWKQLDLFRREAKVLKELSHPGVPRYVDEVTSEDNAVSYLVMEHIPGQSLQQKAREHGALSEAELWRILWQAAGVLSMLHGRNPPIVHRDVKPANLIERPGGDVVLVDFGVVQRDSKPAGGNTFVGTYGFMAPEQFHGDASPATDIYGLGATLIALGSGKEPEEVPHEGLRLKFEDQMHVSEELTSLLKRMTEPEPGKRPLSGVELHAELTSRAALQRRPESTPFVGSIPAPGGLPPPVWMASSFLLTLIGTLGMVGMTVAESVIIPLVFAILAMSAPPQKRARLKQREEQLRAALRTGTSSFKQLGAGSFAALQQQQGQFRADKEARKQQRKLWRQEEKRMRKQLKADVRRGMRH